MSNAPCEHTAEDQSCLPTGVEVWRSRKALHDL